MDAELAGAANIQAVAAVVAAASTVVLAVITFWYARSARKQVSEMTAARREVFHPHVHLQMVRPQPGHDETLRVELMNLGPGPALHIRGFLRHPSLTGYRVPPPQQIAPNAHGTIHFIPVWKSDYGVREKAASDTLQVQVEYRDTLGRWWFSALSIRLMVTSKGFLMERFDTAEPLEGDQLIGQELKSPGTWLEAERDEMWAISR